MATMMSHSTKMKRSVPRDWNFYKRQNKSENREADAIPLDHCYSKIWNCQSDTSQAEPAKHILFPQHGPDKQLKSIPRQGEPDDLEIDVESLDEPREFDFDQAKVVAITTESEREAKQTRPGINPFDEIMNRAGWTSPQNKIFNRVYKVLQLGRMARLATAGQANAPIKQRLHCNKMAKRVRLIFSSFFWDEKLLSWLHCAFLENLSLMMLTEYMEVLQTLKSKVPELIDRMINSSPIATEPRRNLTDFLKRPWDPVSTIAPPPKHVKLSGDPVILIVPMLPQLCQAMASVKSRRFRFWTRQLGNMAKVIVVSSPRHTTRRTVWESFDQMVICLRMKLAEVKEEHPGRPIILIGWNFGALLATYVASMDPVTAVVALGFPLVGINGPRGDADDVVVDSQTATLFVVGEHARTCPVSDLEDLREKMKAENSLLVVGGANDQLNVNFKVKKEKAITQSIVDRCILDEVYVYLQSALSSIDDSEPNPRESNTSATQSTSQTGQVQLKKAKKRSMIVKDSFSRTAVGPDQIPLSVAQLAEKPKKRKLGPVKGTKYKKRMGHISAGGAKPGSESLLTDANISGSATTQSSSQSSLTTLNPINVMALPRISKIEISPDGQPVQAKQTRNTLPLKFEPGQAYRLSVERATELFGSKFFSQTRIGADGSARQHLLTRPSLLNHWKDGEDLHANSAHIRQLLSMEGGYLVPSSDSVTLPSSGQSLIREEPGLTSRAGPPGSVLAMATTAQGCRLPIRFVQSGQVGQVATTGGIAHLTSTPGLISSTAVRIPHQATKALQKLPSGTDTSANQNPAADDRQQKFTSIPVPIAPRETLARLEGSLLQPMTERAGTSPGSDTLSCSPPFETSPPSLTSPSSILRVTEGTSQLTTSISDNRLDWEAQRHSSSPILTTNSAMPSSAAITSQPVLCTIPANNDQPSSSTSGAPSAASPPDTDRMRSCSLDSITLAPDQ